MKRHRILFFPLAVLVGCSPNRARENSHANVAVVTPRWGDLRVHEIGDGTRDHVLVLLHGFGAAGDDLVPLARGIVAANASFRAVLPEAPIVIGGGRAWFSIERDAESRRQLERAHIALLGVLQTLVSQGVEPEHIVLGGFSQGAIMSADLAVRDAHAVGALLLLSGRTLPTWSANVSSNARLKVFVSHGQSDNVLPFAEGEALAQRFRGAGASVEFHPFAGAHAIPPEVESALNAFLRSLAT